MRLDTPGFGPCALTIGNFDGVHAGHRRILRRVVAIAREHGWKPSALTFDPHPTRVVAPDRAPLLLTTPGRRAELMKEEGIEQVLILPFTPELAALTPEEFVRDILCDSLGARAVLVGDNFRFGAGQAGGTGDLRRFGEKCGFLTEIVSAVKQRHRVVSSSGIRRLIAEGEVSVAARMLERPYAIEGEVVHGHGIGSKQTVPTLNLKTSAEILPPNGVYVTRTRDLDDGRVWASVTNIGYRPTFNGDARTIETFLLDPLEGGTPATIGLEFFRRLREERKFDSPEALKRQILRDAGHALAFFRRLKRWSVRVATAAPTWYGEKLKVKGL